MCSMSRIIVVGAGILGAATAYHLTKEGADVTIVDRNDPGQATEAAAGMICPWLSRRRNKAWYRLATSGARYYPELIEALESEGEEDTGYKKVGAIRLHTDEERVRSLEELVRSRKETAPEIGEITCLSRAETKEMFPPLAEGDYMSLHITGAARVNGQALRDAILRSAKRKGAKFIPGKAELIAEGEKILGVKVDSQMIEGDQVIVTAGAWGAEILEQVGLKFLVYPQKAQILHLKLVDADTDDWPVVIPPQHYYLLPFEEGRIIAGTTHEDDKGFDLRPTAGGVGEILGKTLAVAPGLTESTLLETRVGFRPHTPGYLPVFGYAPKYKNLLVANGLGSTGLTAGPFLGLEIARMALGLETELDPSDYNIAQAFE